MSAIIIFDNEFVTVEYRPDTRMIYHTVHQPISDHPQIFKDAMNAGTAALAKYGICKWLSDDRKNGPLPDDLLEWGRTVWNIRTIEAGWRYWANVVPYEVAAASSIHTAIDELEKSGLVLRVFTDLDDAFAWLIEQPDSV